MVEHETDGLEVVISNPTGGQFLTKFILFCVTSGLSDNLTEMLIVKNSTDSNTQQNSDLAQSVEHWCNDQEILGSIAIGAIFG